MHTCPNCGARIDAGVFHSCHAPSYSAPWLQDAITAANQPLLDELKRIREALERQAAQPPAARRERR